MADNNNANWDRLPETPYPALKKLDRLVGNWKISGPKVDGYTTYEWMEGGFFLIQRFDLTYDCERHKGTEYTGFDEDTQTLRSHLIEINGGNFTYTYDIEGDTLWYLFGDKGSDNFSAGYSARTATLSMAAGNSRKVMVRLEAMNIRRIASRKLPAERYICTKLPHSFGLMVKLRRQ